MFCFCIQWGGGGGGGGRRLSCGLLKEPMIIGWRMGDLIVFFGWGRADGGAQGSSCIRTGWRSPESGRQFAVIMPSNLMTLLLLQRKKPHWMAGSNGLLLSRAAKDWAVLVSLPKQLHMILLPLAASVPALMQSVPYPSRLVYRWDGDSRGVFQRQNSKIHARTHAPFFFYAAAADFLKWKTHGLSLLKLPKHSGRLGKFVC